VAPPCLSRHLWSSSPPPLRSTSEPLMFNLKCPFVGSWSSSLGAISFLVCDEHIITGNFDHVNPNFWKIHENTINILLNIENCTNSLIITPLEMVPENGPRGRSQGTKNYRFLYLHFVQQEQTFHLGLLYDATKIVQKMVPWLRPLGPFLGPFPGVAVLLLQGVANRCCWW